jgi:hypothetical protein
MILNATSVATATNSLSLINLIGDSCIFATSSSTSLSQDFSALLTEMTGPTAGQNPIDPKVPQIQVANLMQMAFPAAAQSAEVVSPPVVVALEPKEGNLETFEKSTVDAVYDRAFLVDSTKDARLQTAPTTAEPISGRPESKIASAQEPVQFANPSSSGVAHSAETPALSTDPRSGAAALAAQPGETRKTAVTEHKATSDKAASQNSIVVLLVPFLHSAVSQLTFAGAATDSNAAKIDQPVSEPVPVVTQPELDRAFADVKKFELTMLSEVPTTSGSRVGQQAMVAQDTPLKMAMVTTDPVRNVAQQQLPPRIMPVLKVVPEANPADRSKPSATPGRDAVAGAPAGQFTDVVRPIERVDQAPAAHTIEIPNLSNLPVVRIVAMQVGEADSEVTIRIQQRGTDLTLQLNAANCRLHPNLQSAVGSLANALKLENVPVSGIEVSRRSDHARYAEHEGTVDTMLD